MNKLVIWFCYRGILVIVLNITIYIDYEMREARQVCKPPLSLFSFHANLTTWYQTLGFDYTHAHPLIASALLTSYFF
jgi:hypothetical protein